MVANSGMKHKSKNAGSYQSYNASFCSLHCLFSGNIDVFCGSNLNFTMRFSTWGEANDDNMCEKKNSVQFDQ